MLSRHTPLNQGFSDQQASAQVEWTFWIQRSTDVSDLACVEGVSLALPRLAKLACRLLTTTLYLTTLYCESSTEVSQRSAKGALCKRPSAGSAIDCSSILTLPGTSCSAPALAWRCYRHDGRNGLAD